MPLAGNKPALKRDWFAASNTGLNSYLQVNRWRLFILWGFHRIPGRITPHCECLESVVNRSSELKIDCRNLVRIEELALQATKIRRNLQNGSQFAWGRILKVYGVITLDRLKNQAFAGQLFGVNYRHKKS